MSSIKSAKIKSKETCSSIWRLHTMLSNNVLFAVSMFTILSAVLPVATSQRSRHPDLQGDFCKKRSDPCCLNRNDDCSAPIHRTLCYCDQFCDRDENPDCCPDFWDVCKDGPGPGDLKSCLKNGLYVGHGETIQDNCNQCTCNDGSIHCDTENCLINGDTIHRINAYDNRYGWRAGNYSDFWGKKLSEGLKFKTGTLIPEERVLNMYPIHLIYDHNTIPHSFDARKHWKGQIRAPRDQGWCGASWAFSTLDVYRDRLAIETNGHDVDFMSPQNLLDCNKRGQKGCHGGHIQKAWNYLRKKGVVNEQCYRYESGYTQKVDTCKIPANPTAQNVPCHNSVTKGRDSLYQSEPAYRISSKPNDIMYEIMSKGPLQVIMKVYDDFFMYKSGIYAHTDVGYNLHSTHSVRVIGWGEERSVKYWIAANSWGENWGENGFFRIQKGVNESDFEQFVLAARANLKVDERNTRPLRNRRRRHRHHKHLP